MKHLPGISAALLLAFLAATASRAWSDTTVALIIASVLMFACCWASAIHLLGARAALRFVLLGVSFGWFAEQMGATRGWFFGDYVYTEVLGPRIGAVPVVIPLMWFALSYTGYVIANLLVWQTARDNAASLGQNLVMALLAALIVCAYDLGADPYMVYVLKAWIMAKTDGWWFGETLQGFVGWTVVGGAIILAFRLSLGKAPAQASQTFDKRHALVPLAVYGGSMLFQACQGAPVETRTIAVFAMGIPLLAALCGYQRWQPVAAGAAQ
ncbi:carotenoid biosynthesis protein [Massilia sp. TS11]|uniref:carotenoid biosynthesis protein n=1 Tax=Massilia sp. TS11 TaxID=2908003 RepID=UPI001EDB35BF|nr:carotenoid biosynthesis protein [Massilia sp. TS11]MCG2583602.1 carotenoid biosynthesis protein [Massilia sp. TS11]